MREKMIELVEDARMNALWHIAKNPSEYITDMLIANGVTIPVRCKDCKHGSNHCDKTGFCTYCNFGSVRGRYPVRMEQDDFCSYGERREGE